MERDHFDQSDRLNERKVTLKRRYTENHPAITAGAAARIRNKMLEAIADGKITQDEFNMMLSELSADSKRWMKRNSQYFNVSEDGVTLSKSGSRILNQIKTEKPTMRKLVMESFSDFVNESSKELNEGYVKTAGYNAAVERLEGLERQLDPNSRLCKSISKKADNVVPEFKEMKKHMDEILSIWQEIEYTIAMSNESVDTEGEELNEAFKSAKLRNLLNSVSAAGGSVKDLAKAFYGLTKLKLDKLEDQHLLDYSATAATKEFRKDANSIVFYIVDNEKENPYAPTDAFNYSNAKTLKPGILAISKAGKFLGVDYIKGAGGKRTKTLSTAKETAVGGSKTYSGWDATGLATLKRISEVADRAIVVNLLSLRADDTVSGSGVDARKQIQDRIDAKSGAIAFKSDKDFKKANMARYQEILANKASKLPLDKIVEGAIEELSNQIKNGLAKGERGRYGDIIIGRNTKGSEVRLRDASNHMSSILDDYNRYVDYIAQDEADREREYSTGYYEKQSKEYAKSVNDRVKKIKSFDYAW